MRYHLSILLSLVAIPLLSQHTTPTKPRMDAFNYANQIFKKHGYMAAIDSLNAIAPHFTSDTASMQDKGMFYQAAMTFFSFAGLHRSTLMYELSAFPRRSRPAYSFTDPVRVETAESYLVRHYADANIILLNEAHSRGQHRSFIRSLLPALYAQGFRCLAIETLDDQDSLIHKRGFPVQQTGYYSREPAFGQLIREALAMGFELLPYEQKADQYDATKPYMDNLNEREQAQAENIYQYLKAYPEKKMIVLAGHGHIEKKSDGPWVKMAERLCRMLGRDIPAVECTEMHEAAVQDKEHEIYQAAIDSFRMKVPFVLTLRDTVYVAPRRKGQVDVCVFFPRTHLESGYPDWMKNDPARFETLALPQTLKLEGRLLQVYKETEWDQVKQDAVPVLNIEIRRDGQAFDLYLQPGVYRAIVFDTYQKVLFEQIVQVN